MKAGLWLSSISLIISSIACQPKHEQKEISSTQKTTPIEQRDKYRFEERNIHVSRGQLVYLPVYSNVKLMNQERDLLLTVNVTVRNTDLEHAIEVSRVDYYDENGNLIKKYLDQAYKIPAMGSKTFVVDETDKSGGIGANFLIEWDADTLISEPMIEAVMLGIAGSQGFAFSENGKVLSNH